MLNKIKVPVALQLRVDDVAWHNGSDDRYSSRPSRTGIPRKHVPADYQALHELGKALDMKICCSLVIGEWDKDNLLRGVPHVTWDPDGWDRASEIDMDSTYRSLEILEGSEYLEYMLHGLLHGYYDRGRLVIEEQYYPRVYDAAKGGYTDAWRRLSSEEFHRHLDLFFDICRSWGMKKSVRSFSSPNGCRGTPEENAEYIRIMEEYGIHYWHNGGWHGYPDGVIADAAHGMICCRGRILMPWNSFDVDPALLPIQEKVPVDWACHWPNFLRWNPEHNLERIPAWADYFRRQAEVFGVMLSKDIAFADSQGLYSQFAAIREADGRCVIDLSAVDAKDAIGRKNEFYISVRGSAAPSAVSGGTLSLYETKSDFRTYRITRDGAAQVVLSLA